MNHLNMNGLNAGNGASMPQMTNGIHGVGSRAGSDPDLQNDYEAKLNTYIYDYFLKHERFDCARAVLHSGVNVHVHAGGRRDGDVNGVDEGAMDTDSKDDIDLKRPNDLPAPKVVGPDNTSFLLEWFSLFWDMFLAQRKDNSGASKQAIQYMQHTQQQLKLRQEQQQQYLRQPQFAGNMNQFNIMRMQNGMPDQLRQRALQNNNRNVYVQPTPQQMTQLTRNQHQMMQQQQMQRDGSDMDINGQRPRTPSSGGNAPSPSKRPRLQAPPFNGQQMMQNGRVPQPGLQGQQMMHPNVAEANNLLMQHGINPNSLSQTQLESFQNQNTEIQKKSILLYTQNMNQEHRQNMPQPGMANQGSPMMQPGIDVGAAMPNFYDTNPAMRMGSVQGTNGAGGNHALQDYQMQLMLLEQQNKKRLLMARQEQDNLGRDGPQSIPGQPGFPPGMSPQGSRSGPSPNPSDQMKRSSPKMGQALPGSPMPDGSMPQARGSPAAMNYAMAPDMFQGMKGMGDGMGGPNGNVMRPPSSHPQFNSGQFNPQMEMMARVQAGGRMPNGSWQHGPQGQASMIPQPSQAQQPTQIGTPQQRTAMPPPQPPQTSVTINGRPGSPAPTAAPPTPGQFNKANPKGKKDGKEPRKRTAKKGSTTTLGTAATPSSEAENPPPTTTPSTPITPQNQSSFNSQKNVNGQNQVANLQAVTSAPATGAPIPPPQPDVNNIGQFGPMDDVHQFDMTFGSLDGEDVLGEFDFGSYLQDSGGHDDLNFDPAMAFVTTDGVEAGTGDA